MSTFAFIVTVWFSDGSPPNVYVEDYDLSGIDCIALLEAYTGTAEASCIKE